MQIPSQARVVRIRAGSNPLLTALCVLLALVVGVAFLLILLPVAIVLGLAAAIWITVRRAFARVGTPNNTVAGVRTDGRENVRVVTRDS
ncbi:MAG: hypothetical protein AAFR96_12010 [Planctomycetota bacterium]